MFFPDVHLTPLTHSLDIRLLEMHCDKTQRERGIDPDSR